MDLSFALETIQAMLIGGSSAYLSGLLILKALKLN